MPTCTALIVAGGRGSRFGGPLPKQYALLEGQPVLRRTIAAFRATPGIDGIRVVIGPGDEAHFATAVAGLDLPPPVEGGASRQQSVLNGLEALAVDPPDLVAIHDAARPFVRPADIAACLTAVPSRASMARSWACRLADTLKKVDGAASIVQYPAARATCGGRRRRRSSATPRCSQAHRAAARSAAHEATALTDDAAVAERAGLKVVMVQGHDDNRKITTVRRSPARRRPWKHAPPSASTCMASARAAR